MRINGPADHHGQSDGPGVDTLAGRIIARHVETAAAAAAAFRVMRRCGAE